MSDMGNDDRILWSVIFQAATAITRNEESKGQVMSSEECKAVVDGLCDARGFSFSDQQKKAAHTTVQAIRGSAIVKELIDRWHKEGQPSFTASDVHRASEVLQRVMNDFLSRRR